MSVTEYLENTRRNLARMLDFAVYDLKYDIADLICSELKRIRLSGNPDQAYLNSLI